MSEQELYFRICYALSAMKEYCKENQLPFLTRPMELIKLCGLVATPSREVFTAATPGCPSNRDLEMVRLLR